MSASLSSLWARLTLLILALSTQAFGQLGGATSITINGSVGGTFFNGLANQGCWITGAITNGSLFTTESNPPPFFYSRAANGGGSCWALAVFGSPTHAFQGTTVVTITETGNTGSATLTINWNITAPLSFPSATLAQATAGRPYSAQVSASGGTGGITYSITGGQLPNGLLMAPSGSISGTTTAAGTYNFTVTATDSQAASAQQSFTITVNQPPTLSSISGQFRTVGQAFSLSP